MNPQTIVTASGDRLVVLPEEDYATLLQAAEDNADRTAISAFRRKLAAGEEELIPSIMIDRLLAGENPIKVWREFRGRSVTDLAADAGLAQAFLSQIENGKREGTAATLRIIAEVLGVTIDDLVNEPAPTDPTPDEAAGYTRIEALLASGEAFTTAEIAKRLALSAGHIGRVMRWLHGNGRATLVPGSTPFRWTKAA